MSPRRPSFLCLGVLAIFVATTAALADTSGSSTTTGTFDVGNPLIDSIVIPVNEVIQDVEVSINVEHSWVGDVIFTLSNTQGSSVFLIGNSVDDGSNLGDDPSNNDILVPAIYVFTDTGSATQNIEDAADDAPLSASEIPAGDYWAHAGQGALAAAFAGDSTADTWTLSLVDQVTFDDGTLDGWSISFVSVEPPDLTISKTDSMDPVIAGSTLTYTITVSNAGPIDAEDVVVTETLPAGVTLLSTNGCEEDPVAVPTCTLGTIANGASDQYTVTVRVDSDTLGTITNMASVSSSTPLTNTGDDSVSEDTTVDAQVALAISKSDSPDPVVAGTQLAYTITVDNLGPSDAQDVVVTDTLPTGVSAVSTSGCAEDPNGVPTCTLGTIAALASKQYTLTVAVDPGTLGTLLNEATATSSTELLNPGETTTFEQTTVVGEADLVLDKFDDEDPVLAGLGLIYILEVTNNGPSDARNVVLTDNLPAGVTLVSTNGCNNDPNGVPNCTLGTIDEGDGRQVVISVDVDPGTTGTITNMASVASSTTLINTGNDTASESTQVNGLADLNLIKSDSPDPVNEGSELVYTIVVENDGPSDAQNVVMTDNLPAGLSNPVTSGCAEDPNGVPACTLGTVEAGGFKQYTITATVDTGAGPSILNMVTVDSTTTLTGAPDASEQTTIDPEEIDFGDAPDNYQTLLASDGARHGGSGALFLGSLWDAETNGQPGSGADGDDTGGLDDEDGIAFTTPIELAEDSTSAVLDVTASAQGFLDAWIDFNADGDWDDQDEQVYSNNFLAAGANVGQSFTSFADAVPGPTYARLRFSTAGGTSSSGFATDGEVEDYAVTIKPVDFLNLSTVTGPSRTYWACDTITLATGFTVPAGVEIVLHAGIAALFEDGSAVQTDGALTVLTGSVPGCP